MRWLWFPARNLKFLFPRSFEFKFQNGQFFNAREFPRKVTYTPTQPHNQRENLLQLQEYTFSYLK